MRKVGNKTLTREARGLDVVVLSVYLLGGDRKSVDTEDAAVRAHELAPGMFSWRKFPGQINLELVRVNLSNAKKPQYGGLLCGSGREGWRLSTAGLAWVTSQGRQLLKKGLRWNADSRRAGSIDTVRKDRERTRLLASDAWKDWKDGNPMSVRDARDVFRVNEYSTGKMVEIKVVKLQSLFKEDAAMGRFLREAGTLVLETGGSQ